MSNTKSKTPRTDAALSGASEKHLADTYFIRLGTTP